MNGVPNPVGYDIIQASNGYVTFSSTLAAIVFAAVVLLLSNPPSTSAGKEKVSSNHVFPGLITAFASLAVAAFLFIGLAGTQEQAQTLAFLLSIGGDVVFSLAVLQLLLSISWCFDAYGFDVAGLKWLISGVIVAVGTYLVISIGDYLWDITGTNWKASGYFLPLAIGGVACLLVLPLGFGWLIRLRLICKRPPEAHARVYRWAIIISATLSIVVAVVFALPDAPGGKVLGYQPFQESFPNPLGFALNFPLMLLVGICETLYVVGMPRRLSRSESGKS